MDNYSMILPAYTIGEESYQSIKKFCSPHGKTAVIIGGHTALSKAKEEIVKNCEGSITITDTLWYGGECSYENVNKLLSHPAVTAADMIFAVGGGKATDTCKVLGDKLDKPVFTFPTIASNCACCTAVSIMYREDGSFIEPYFFLQPPVHAFINTKIICEAPDKYLWAGMGDTYAKYYEAEISARGETPEHFKAFGIAMSRMCKDPILIYGKKALEDNRLGRQSYELQQTVLAICITTGLVSIFLTRDHTPDYNSGLAHAIFYALTKIGIEENHLHGEVVAYGVLICLLCDKRIDEFKVIQAFNESVGLPVRLADLGLTREEFNRLLPDITSMSDIRHYPYQVTVQMLTDALDILNE